MGYQGKQADPELSRAAWRHARDAALARDLGLCQDCLARHMQDPSVQVRPATLVHHILPRSTHPDLTCNLDNLISLCARHHEARHPERHAGRPGQEPEIRVPEGVRVIKI